MNTDQKPDLLLINPNWSAFVLLVTLLSIVNRIVLLVAPITDDAAFVLETTNNLISLVLWADFIYLLRKAPDKRTFMGAQRGWLVLLGSFPFMRILRILWFWLTLRDQRRSFRNFLSRIVIKQNAQGTLLLVLFIVIVVFEASVVSILSLEEGQPGSTIDSVSDAVWWAFVSVSTVGYGDEYPVTNGGRLVAMLLMAVGIALFSVITSSLAEWFRESQRHSFSGGREGEPSSTEDAIADMKALLERQEQEFMDTVTEIKARLSELEGVL
jgi:voltage-gated potassium channel